ncbi:hypothetical protein ACEPAI_3085 [Sanghuangporus weigelae]
MQAAADHRVAPAKLIIFWKQMLIQHVNGNNEANRHYARRLFRFTGGTRSVGTHPNCFGPVPVLLSIPTVGLPPNFRAATEWMIWPVRHPEFFN